MAKSMTGFGYYELNTEAIKITVEMKSVNHRFLDLNLKLPRKFSFFETEARALIREKLSRGKVDVFVSYQENTDAGTEIIYHPQIAQKYYEGLNSIKEQFGFNDVFSASTLARFPDVFTEEAKEEDQDELRALLTQAFSGAVDDLIKNRATEGDRLKADLLQKFEEMEGYVSEIEKRAPEILSEYKSRLIQKVHELLENNQIDENRIAAEVVLYADKICVDEEIVRLKSHINEARDTLTNDSEVGRKLDFLAQELNRESNTILSKSTDVTIADLGIELKTLIEKIREQIQNLE